MYELIPAATGPQYVSEADRLPTYHQLDLRVDYSFRWGPARMAAFLDVLNVYNHQSPEFVNYSYDYSQYNNIPTLPIIPSLGFRLEM